MAVSRKIRRRDGAEPAAELAGLHPVIQSLYASRGARNETDVELPMRALLPISSLGNACAAAALIWTHRQGRVLVVGDFDADGATSTALVLRCLRRMGFENTDYLVPNRFEFGYGLTTPLVELALASKPTLIITVDNGISSVAGTALARDHDVDVLITDHHLPPDELPSANLIVNPNQGGEEFGSGKLAGVGVAFYVMMALGRHAASEGIVNAERIAPQYLDLVALGTIADVVALDRNNRILVNAGLKRIRAGQCLPAIKALLAVGKRDFFSVQAADLAFAVGPRLNAAGRLEDMSVGIEALLSDNPASARDLAATLNEINSARREIEADMQREAQSAVESLTTTSGPGACVTLYEPAWHQGVVGLIASRVKEQLHRPVFAFAHERDGLLKGSGRSITGIHLRDLLAYIDAQSPGLIQRFGGHAMAAGLTLTESGLATFRQLAAEACATLYPEAPDQGEWLVDGELSAAELVLEFAEQLQAAGPFGQGFEPPLFSGQFSVVEARIVGQKHLKLTVLPEGSSRSLGAIAFNQSEHFPLPIGTIADLVYHLEVNEFRGVRNAQLMVQEMVIQPAA